MDMTGPNKRSLPPALQGGGVRRTSNKKVRYLSVLDDNCELNADALIERAKASAVFGDVPWEAATWDVSASESQRGHKQRGAYLNFTQHLLDIGTGSRVGDSFDNENGFSDLVKAVIRSRREVGGQVVNNQAEVIIAFRYIHHELRNVGYDLKMLTPGHLDAAARSVHKRETEVSAYKRLEKIEEVARLLDENGLVRAQLNWRCGSKSRPGSLTHGRLDLPEAEQANQSKLPQDGIIEAIAYLYHTIPRAAWADRVRICLVSLLVITGFRVGELLTLPARRVQTEDETGRRFLVYYPEKGAPPQKKWLMTAGGDLAAEVIDELLELTKDARKIAGWLHDHTGELLIDGMDWNREVIPTSEVAALIGLVSGNTDQFFKNRKIPLMKNGEHSYVFRDDLLHALRDETYSRPVNVVKNTGEEVLLKDSLACVFRNAFHSHRATLRYAVCPISEQQLSDFISPRAGQATAFDKYGVKGSDGSMLKVASHAFRHWLNDLLDRGGLSDVEQAVYFGRRNPKDNRAYQHMTPAERVRKAREDLMNGNLLGPVAQVIARLPIDRQEIVLAARVQAVHIVPGGACFHQFSQSPCPNHMACTDGCGDFHWLKDDPIQLTELQFQKSVLDVAVDTAKREVDEESWGADNWLQHNVRKLKQVNKCIAQVEPPALDFGNG